MSSLPLYNPLKFSSDKIMYLKNYVSSLVLIALTPLFFCFYSLIFQVFHCVHFECPAQTAAHKEEASEEDMATNGQQLTSRSPRASSTSSVHSVPGSTTHS